MSPDDPRHGQPRGYHAGCREACCKAAIAGYQARRVYEAQQGRKRRVDATGTARRVQALVAIGYTFGDIAAELGCAHDVARKFAHRETTVRSSTAQRVAAVFDRLCMKPAPGGRKASYARTVARNHGWVPPLAWDDATIDDPDARPQGHVTPKRNGRAHTDVDPALVQRLVDGDWSLAPEATKAEKREVCRIWTARGGSLTELERHTGWMGRRYWKVAAA